MKILILYSDSITDFPSGEKRVAEFESSLLQKNGHDVKLVKYSNKILKKSPFKLLLPFVNIWSPLAYFFVKKKISSFNPDLIHFHGINPFLSASAIYSAAIFKLPIFVTLHSLKAICIEGSYFREGHYCNKCQSKSIFNALKHQCNRGFLNSMMFLISLRLLKFIYTNINYVTKFIAVSSFIQEEYIKYGIDPKRIVVKNNAVNKNLIMGFYKKYNFEDRKSIVYVARMSEAKGLGVIKFLIQNTTYNYEIIGDGPGYIELSSFCIRNNYKNVILHGHLNSNETLTIVSKALCSLIPSICSEAFGLVAVECMALGIPIIASNVGGLGKLIQQSQSGLTVNEDYNNGFLSALNAFFSNPTLLEEFSINGHNYFRTNLTEEINYLELIKVYNNEK